MFAFSIERKKTVTSCPPVKVKFLIKRREVGVGKAHTTRGKTKLFGNSKFVGYFPTWKYPTMVGFVFKVTSHFSKKKKV